MYNFRAHLQLPLPIQHFAYSNWTRPSKHIYYINLWCSLVKAIHSNWIQLSKQDGNCPGFLAWDVFMCVCIVGLNLKWMAFLCVCVIIWACGVYGLLAQWQLVGSVAVCWACVPLVVILVCYYCSIHMYTLAPKVRFNLGTVPYGNTSQSVYTHLITTLCIGLPCIVYQVLHEHCNQVMFTSTSRSGEIIMWY